MQNNFDILKEFMDFSDPGKFYLALVVQRKKDNPGLDRSEHIIKNYMIPSLDKLERIRSEMETLSKVFNARVYLYINRRSFKNTQRAMAKALIDQICLENCSNLNHLFDSCAAAHGCGDRYWIIDVDMPDRSSVSADTYQELENGIKSALFQELDKIEPVMPEGETKTKLVLPTKNGFHIVTRPFDTRKWEYLRNTVLSLEHRYNCEIDLELKKDAMVNLILPD
jgi:hypothetical protein